MNDKTTKESDHIMNNKTLRGRILIVDDEEMNLEFLSNVLTAEGHTVFKARDGIEAFDKINKVDFDLVLLDLAMPQLNGLEVCHYLRRNPKGRQVAILIVTGNSEVENRTSAYQVGADDFLPKPVGQLELVSRVRALLRLRDYKFAAERQQAAAIAARGEVVKIIRAIEETKDALMQPTKTPVSPFLDDVLDACRRLEQHLQQ